MPEKPSVLFVCVHNAGRSQMATGFLVALAGDRIDVHSAGTEPADAVNPVAVAAMAEVGIDITPNQPTALTPDAARRADIVITMGCGETCPVFPGTRYEDWALPDPAGQPLAVVRAIRNEIEDRVKSLVAALVPGGAIDFGLAVATAATANASTVPEREQPCVESECAAAAQYVQRRPASRYGQPERRDPVQQDRADR